MSNRAHLHPGGVSGNGDGAGVHPLGRTEAEQLAAEYNLWCSYMQVLGPLPLRFHVAEKPVRWHGADGATMAVQMIGISPNGPHVMYLTPDQADELGGLLTKYATIARTGLVTL